MDRAKEVKGENRCEGREREMEGVGDQGDRRCVEARIRRERLNNGRKRDTREKETEERMLGMDDGSGEGREGGRKKKRVSPWLGSTNYQDRKSVV